MMQIPTIPELQAKAVEYGIIALVILSGWLFGAYQLHELHVYQQNQADQIAENVRLKTQEEKQHAQDTISIASGYSTQLDALTKRLRDAKAVPRGASVPVAGQVGNSGSVPHQTSPTSGIDASGSEYTGTESSAFYDNALADVIQLQNLQAWVSKVCM